MNKTFFYWLRTLHAWGGVTLALLLMLISFTGIFLIWKQEYLWLTIPQARAEFNPTPANLAVIGEAVDQHFEFNEVISLQFATKEFPLTYVILTDGRYAYLDASGTIVDQWSGNARFEEFIYDLHHRLLFKDLGLNIVGISAITMLVLILVGFISYWPFRRGFNHGIRPNNTSRQQLVKSHRNLGVLFTLPILFILLTGITLVYPQQIENWLLDEIRNTQEYSDAMVDKVDNITGGDSGDWLPAMQRALNVFPNSSIRSAQVPSGYSYYRIFGIQKDGELNRQGMNRVYIDSTEGYMDLRIDTVNFPLRERALNTFYPLHTGKANSLLYKILLSIMGISLFTLSSLGLVSFIKRYTEN